MQLDALEVQATAACEIAVGRSDLESEMLKLKPSSLMRKSKDELGDPDDRDLMR